VVDGVAIIGGSTRTATVCGEVSSDRSGWLDFGSQEANKQRRCYNLAAVALRSCRIHVTSLSGIQHSVDVTADSLYEAAALALKLLREDGWTEPIGPATRLEIQVTSPAVTHRVTIAQVHRWAEGTATTPAERLRKDRVLALLG
jgi:hypothetical protein